MEPEKNMEMMIWDYLDGRLSPQEIEIIESLISKDPDWKKAFHEFSEMNIYLKLTETEVPSMRFSRNVMDEIAKHKIAPAAKSYVNKKIVYGIAGFFLVIITGFLVYLFTQVSFSAAPDTNILPVKMPEINVDWKKWFNPTFVQFFLMADAVFGLMLLDRYLAKKRRQMREDRQQAAGSRQ